MERIFLIGYMGSGKTSMGKMLAQTLNFVFVDMDEEIEAKHNQTVSEIFAEFGQDRFREIERECLHELSHIENAVIATGGGAPCFFDNMEYMNAHGLAVYIKHSAEELAARLEASSQGKRPLIADKKGEELLSFIKEALASREPFYTKAKLIVSGTDEEMIAQISSAVKSI